jgi:hypothetical protein
MKLLETQIKYGLEVLEGDDEISDINIERSLQI